MGCHHVRTVSVMRKLIKEVDHLPLLTEALLQIWAARSVLSPNPIEGLVLGLETIQTEASHPQAENRNSVNIAWCCIS